MVELKTKNNSTHKGNHSATKRWQLMLKSTHNMSRVVSLSSRPSTTPVEPRCTGGGERWARRRRGQRSWLPAMSTAGDAGCSPGVCALRTESSELSRVRLRLPESRDPEHGGKRGSFRLGTRLGGLLPWQPLKTDGSLSGAARRARLRSVQRRRVTRRLRGMWGPTPGIEDGEVAAGDDPATPRWAWIRGRGFAGAGGGLGSPGEAKWPVRWNYAPHPPLFALVAGFLCSLSQSSFPLLATPSFLQRFLLSGCRLFAPVSPFSLSYPGFCLTNPVWGLTHQKPLTPSDSHLFPLAATHSGVVAARSPCWIYLQLPPVRAPRRVASQARPRLLWAPPLGREQIALVKWCLLIWSLLF